MRRRGNVEEENILRMRHATFVSLGSAAWPPSMGAVM